MDKSFKNLISWGASLLIVIALVGGSYYVGYDRGRDNPEQFVVEGINNIETDKAEVDFGIFWEAWQKLKDIHIKGNELSDTDFFYSAIEGLAGVFKDPNTIFLRADTGDAQKFEEDIRGSFGGIGAEIGLKDSQLIIVAPLKNSPAEKAGLQSGDKILEINDFGTEGITVNDAVKRIRGEIGTTVVLNMLRDEWDSSRDISIVRQEIVVPTLDWEIIDTDGARLIHVKLHSFNEKASLAFYEAAINATLNRAQGMILDLRDDPGGFLEVAVNLAGWFLEKGAVVTTEDFRSDSDRVFRANGNEAFKDTPVVILVNQGSASASEILAGALRDHRGIKLVGEQTFGKGTVQELHGLRDGSQLKITVANWVLPKGDVIEKNGLKPDFEIKRTEEDAKAQKDPQLEKAIEVLKAEITR